MKVSGPTKIESARVTRTGRREGGGDGTFSLDKAAAEKPAAAVAQTNPLASVDTLLALQAVPYAGDGRSGAMRRANEMLDLLDEIRVSLLDGLLPKVKLERLVRVVRVGRDDVADPRLSRVLDEIELRARVELAKFGATSFGDEPSHNSLGSKI